jgi:hypothetical protein
MYGTAGQATDDNITQRMRFACWITKATDTHSEYVTPIAFPRQQRLREVLRYTYIASLFIFTSSSKRLTTSRQCYVSHQQAAQSPVVKKHRVSKSSDVIEITAECTHDEYCNMLFTVGTSNSRLVADALDLAIRHSGRRQQDASV